jgi:hypothetical protein
VGACRPEGLILCQEGLLAYYLMVRQVVVGGVRTPGRPCGVTLWICPDMTGNEAISTFISGRLPSRRL